MASTNAQQFNPAAINQETDSQYTADSNRAGGFGVDAIWPSPLANKTLYQLSTYITALFQAFANKGFTTSDADLSVLTAVCANFLTTADTLPQIATVGYSPTPAFNGGASSGFSMTLAGNITSSTISGTSPGQLIAFYFTQDSVGGRTVVWPSNVAGGAQPDPAANSISLQLFRVGLSTALFAATPMVSANGYFFPSQINGTSAAFSGAVSGATAASSDNSTRLVTSAWAKTGLLSSFSANGYFKLPNWLGGFMIQWGNLAMPGSSGTSNPTNLTFPTVFPTQCFQLISWTQGTIDRITFTISFNASGGVISNNGSGVSAGWVAIGN